MDDAQAHLISTFISRDDLERWFVNNHKPYGHFKEKWRAHGCPYPSSHDSYEVGDITGDVTQIITIPCHLPEVCMAAHKEALKKEKAK